jgi:RimJ/RimL family protein N-acetyltransferase
MVDDTSAQKPGPVVLKGRYGRVERLDPTRHGPAFWTAVRGHDRLWTYLSYGPFADETAFTAWLAERSRFEDPFYYAVLDTQDCAVGIAAFRDFRPAMRTIEIGHVVYAPALQRTPLATEAQYLLARYAFETLGYRRYEWRCHTLNDSSYRAALRLGFTFESIARQHMITKGRSRDTAWFSMLDTEWPARRAAFEAWLSPDNFDSEGRQRRSLGASPTSP